MGHMYLTLAPNVLSRLEAIAPEPTDICGQSEKL